MQLEIPECRRCCCFIPLRYGIIVFGYLNLIFSLLILGLEIWLVTIDRKMEHTVALYRGASFITQAWLTITLYLLEAIFDVVLLVGAHLKNPSLLRVYYYYGITTTSAIASLVIFLTVKHYEALYDWNTALFEGCFIFSGFALQIYLLLLIRTELKKLKQNSQLSFINHAAEVVVVAPHGGEGRNPF
ncbi:unnamed protein product [Parnassius apollo]|uniref:(apollo) hypothetical protein n=1 Tax=Parnassius apollo TaxID=110799 RepID=A0A8S3XW51_PARAO|nr:unnamed protein product [Parnassius apollo]